MKVSDFVLENAGTLCNIKELYKDLDERFIDKEMIKEALVNLKEVCILADKLFNDNDLHTSIILFEKELGI